MPERDDRILAIMMKAPRAGTVKTRLQSAYAPEAILTLYRAFVEDTIDLARSVGLRTVAMCPAADEGELRQWLPEDIDVVPQGGSGLAVGLLSTFEELCPRGPRVIAFNADSPHLPAAVLESAFAALTENDVVVGPCDDGGYYLVGAKRPYPGLFDATTMGKNSACGALLAQAELRELRVAMVAEHYDVDLPPDVERLARDLAREPGRARRTAALLSLWNRSVASDASADGR
jgi:rSAM/selenodomain-associated transferase 1